MLDIVANLNQVVDLGALADDGIADGAAVDGCAGADFDVVLDDDPADLRHLEMSVAAHHKAEPVLPDIAARMDDDAVADRER